MSLSVDPTARNSEMQTISSWKDVTPFAGSIVAYKTDSYYFENHKGFVLEDTSINFGYINKNDTNWASGEAGYNMTRLVQNAGDSLVYCALVDENLEPPISMRITSPDEIRTIGLAVIDGRAEFELAFCSQATEALKRRFLKLS